MYSVSKKNETMRVMGIEQPIAIHELTSKIKALNIACPAPKKGEVLLRVLASSINIDDIHVMEGTMMGGIPLKPKASLQQPTVPGSDVVGIVERLGEGVRGFRPGQKVYGICTLKQACGAWAEYCLVEAHNIAPAPLYIQPESLAAFPIAASLAVQCIEAANNVSQKKCLVIGASGGIGSFCVQALHTLSAEVYGICSEKNQALVKELGATEVLAYDQANYPAKIAALQGKIDFVFDFVGGKKREQWASKLVKPGGRFITVVGPNEWIGQKKLNYFQFLKMFGYIFWRSRTRHWFTKKHYQFVTFKSPKFQKIQEWLLEPQKQALVDSVIDFTPESIRQGIDKVVKHKTRGRVVISIASE